MTITLESGVTYRVRDSLVLTGVVGDPIILQSSVPDTQAILTLDPTATQEVERVNATDIDSSLGRTIFDYRGTLDNATNWRAMAAVPAAVAYPLVG